MIVCICRRLNERDIHEAIASGARCPDSVQAECGGAFNCGACRQTIDDMLDASEATRPDALPAAAE